LALSFLIFLPLVLSCALPYVSLRPKKDLLQYVSPPWVSSVAFLASRPLFWFLIFFELPDPNDLTFLAFLFPRGFFSSFVVLSIFCFLEEVLIIADRSTFPVVVFAQGFSAVQLSSKVVENGPTAFFLPCFPVIAPLVIAPHFQVFSFDLRVLFRENLAGADLAEQLSPTFVCSPGLCYSYP